MIQAVVGGKGTGKPNLGKHGQQALDETKGEIVFISGKDAG